MKKSVLTLVLSLTILYAFGQTISPFIIVDQFGYLPDAEKIAIIKNPQVGFDAGESFTPGSNYAVVNANTDEVVFTGNPDAWKNGQTDASSGDKVWWFDFSSVIDKGNYYVHDVDKNLRSFEFSISPGIYNELLRQAMRTFFYQRVGYAKNAQFAGEGWADGASHVGSDQDLNCRLFNKSNDASTERDVSGGWYDAGDYNKYTNWTASYVIELMKAYLENPEAFGDDYNIPESGNGIPDILDEAKWGVDHLLRLQEEDGSVLSIVGESHESPPSSATGKSLYGPATTSASQNTAAALAIASKVYQSISLTEYADNLKSSAIKAWDWAVANPDVLFRNNDSDYGSEGIGAGQQEESDYQRLMGKLRAATHLYEITEDEKYKTFFDANYTETHMIQWNFAFPFEASNQETLLYYTAIPGATPSVVNNIINVYKDAMNTGSENFPAYTGKNDPYRAHLKDYTWGSNSVKSLQGNMYFNMIIYNVDASKNEEAGKAAIGYLNYIHGVNPLNMTYLSNMYKYGGDNCVNEFYHTWFTNGSAKWDRVGESTYGPPPGFLVGGANPSYDWDGCCPQNCGGGNNSVCTSESLIPPKDQPDQKSYKDFNTSWPLNSWSVTENSCGYQVNYIKLLSKFIDASLDCNGDKDGTAFYDECGTCAGGNTGIDPVTDADECETNKVTGSLPVFNKSAIMYPNPANGMINFTSLSNEQYSYLIYNSKGDLLKQGQLNKTRSININDLSSGIFSVKLIGNQKPEVYKFLKR